MERRTIPLRSFDSSNASIMPVGGRSLTIPGQSVNISDAITRYSAPTILEKVKGYYEEEGMELPNFDRLDKVERLQLLADTKANMFRTKAAAENAISDANAKAEKAKEEKAKADKAENDAANINPIPSTSNTNSDVKNGK